MRRIFRELLTVMMREEREEKAKMRNDFHINYLKSFSLKENKKSFSKTTFASPLICLTMDALHVLLNLMGFQSGRVSFGGWRTSREPTTSNCDNFSM